MSQIGQNEVELLQGIIRSYGEVPQSDNTVALLTQWLQILISQI